MNNKYSNAFSEVLKLFDNFLSEEDYNKIPKEQIDYMRKNSNSDYNYEIDESKDLMEQNVSKEAKAVILSLYKSYFSDADENQKINNYIRLNDKKKYIEKSIDNKTIEEDNHNPETKISVNETSLIVKRESWLKKFLNRVFSFFTK